MLIMILMKFCCTYVHINIGFQLSVFSISNVRVMIFKIYDEKHLN